MPYGPKPKPPIERLLPRLTPEPNTGCWLWTGNCNQKGYGQIGVGAAGMTTTHKTAYLHFKGPIPPGMQILHSCDVPCCCNPDHLSIGTHQDNIDDKMRKGRHKAGVHHKLRGEKNHLAKLTEQKVRHIKRRELTPIEYARLYGVSNSAVRAVLSGKTWRHVHV